MPTRCGVREPSGFCVAVMMTCARHQHRAGSHSIRDDRGILRHHNGFLPILVAKGQCSALSDDNVADRAIRLGTLWRSQGWALSHAAHAVGAQLNSNARTPSACGTAAVPI